MTAAVAAPLVGATAVVGPRRRRLHAVLARWPYLLVLVAIIASVGPPLWGHGVLHGSDLLGSLPPWRADHPAGFLPENGQVSDTVNAVIPLRDEFIDRLRHGDLALWAPDQGSGIPLGAVPDLSLLSPLSLPYYLLPLWWAPAVGKALEMAVAAAFTALFLRRLGTGRVPAAVAGLVYMESGFQIAWTNWPQTYVGAFVPMLFWAVERSVQLRTARALVPVALAVAFLLLGGFPAVAAHALLAAGIYAVVRLALAGGGWRDRAARLVAIGVGVGLGGGLAALQLLPFAARMRELDLGYRATVSGQHLPLDALVTSVVPWASGAYVDGVQLGPRGVVESLSYVGVAAAVLMVVAAVGAHRLGLPRGVRGVLWTLLVVGGLLVYVGGPFLSAAEHVLPPVFAGNFVGRLRAVLCFLAAVLAGLGAQVLADPARQRLTRRALLRGMLPRAVLAVGVVVLLIETAGRASYHTSIDAQQYVYLRHQLRVPFVLGLVTLLVVAAAVVLRPRWRALAVALLPVLVVVQALPVVWTFWPRIPRTEFYPVTPTHRWLAAHLGQDRLVSQQRVLEPGSTSYYDLRTVAAHQFFEAPWRELLTTADPNAFVRGRNTFPFFGTDDAASAALGESRIMDRLAVRYYVTNPGHLALGRQPVDVRGDGTVSIAPGAAVTAAAPTGTVRALRIWLTDTVRAAAGRPRASLLLTLTGPDGAVLARSERRVDDAPLSVIAGTVDIAVPQVQVPAGSTVRLQLVGGAGSLPLRRAGDGPAVAAVLAEDDGFRTAYADVGSVVYQRTGALPRLRWASRSKVVTSPLERIEDLAAGVPDDTVVLSRPGPAATGAPATVRAVATGDGDEVGASVDAAGAGYLVVADGLQQGWTATLDGRAVPLVDADHALVAVRVPAGRHQVRLRYDPPSLRAGLGASALSLLACAALVAVTPLRRRARRQAAGPADATDRRV